MDRKSSAAPLHGARHSDSSSESRRLEDGDAWCGSDNVWTRKTGLAPCDGGNSRILRLEKEQSLVSCWRYFCRILLVILLLSPEVHGIITSRALNLTTPSGYVFTGNYDPICRVTYHTIGVTKVQGGKRLTEKQFFTSECLSRLPVECAFSSYYSKFNAKLQYHTVHCTAVKIKTNDTIVPFYVLKDKTDYFLPRKLANYFSYIHHHYTPPFDFGYADVRVYNLDISWTILLLSYGSKLCLHFGSVLARPHNIGPQMEAINFTTVFDFVPPLLNFSRIGCADSLDRIITNHDLVRYRKGMPEIPILDSPYPTVRFHYVGGLVKGDIQIFPICYSINTEEFTMHHDCVVDRLRRVSGWVDPDVVPEDPWYIEYLEMSLYWFINKILTLSNYILLNTIQRPSFPVSQRPSVIFNLHQ